MQKNQDWSKQLRFQRHAHHLSLEDLAEQLKCDAKTIGRWEQGRTYPSPYMRRKLAELLDIRFVDQIDSPSAPATREDWGEAPHIEHFYGREQELDCVLGWMQQERCRVIAITGIAGVGKTTFALVAARQAVPHFERVWWRSLQNAPTLEQLLTSCLRFLCSGQQREIPQQIDEQLSLLLEKLREQRCLLILDNAESLLQPNESAGQYLPTHAGYGQLMRVLGEVQHQSCLLLTSREKLQDIAHLEGITAPVRVFALTGLRTEQCRTILQDQQLHGTDENWTVLTWLYRGNPLALKLVAEPIREVFQGDLASFLNQEANVFGDIHTLLEQQFARLSALELELIYWLAIEREATSLATLCENVLPVLNRGAVLEALDSLRRRSLVETSQAGQFALQPVILENATGRLIRQILAEIEQGQIGLLGTHALLKAGAKDYIRQAQIRFILTPVAERLLQRAGRNELEREINALLSQLHQMQKPDYAAGNLLNLLLHLQFDLRGYDFSALTIRQAYLQNMRLAQVNFASATFTHAVFTQTFSSLQCVAASPDGQLLAAGTTTGEVWFWQLNDLTPLGTCLGHVDGLRALTFSHDSRWLASGGEDEQVRIWDAETRSCRHCLSGHTDMIRALAFSPTGNVLASSSEDQTIRLWDTLSGKSLGLLQGHNQRVRALVFDESGERLISGSEDLTIRFWESGTGQLLNILQSGQSHVMALAYDAGRQILISGHEDGQVQLWSSETGQYLRTLRGHSDRIWSLVVDPAGQWLASSGEDQRICLWKLATGELSSVLPGHSGRIWSLTITPDAQRLISVSEDETLRVWDIQSGVCLQVLRGYLTLIKALAFSPDGRLLLSGSEDQLLCLWDMQSGQQLKAFAGHTRRVRAVAYSPDGVTLASGSEDESIKLWDSRTGECVRTLQGHTHLVRAVAFSPDAQRLASAGYDATIRLWDVRSGQALNVWSGEHGRIWSLDFSSDGQYLVSAGEDHIIRTWASAGGRAVQSFSGHQHHVWSVAFAPDGRTLVSGSDDRTVRLWESTTGTCLRVLQGHTHWVRSVAFSPDGQRLASASHDQTIKVWDANSGACLHTLAGHRSWVWSVVFSPDSQSLASCGDDGTIRLWDVISGRCMRILRHSGPYEGMNITGTTGLSAAQRLSLKLLGAVEE